MSLVSDVNRFKRKIAALAFMLVFLLGCSEDKKQSLNLVVASSLTNVTQDLANELSLALGVKVQVHAGASSVIARQIAHGLACDVVITADDDWMDYLEQGGHIESRTRRLFLENSLVWIRNSEAKEGTKKRLAIGEPEHVPAGKYAKEALQRLGMWERYKGRIVEAPDVRTALTWVENSSVDEGIVYETDALSSQKVKILRRLDEPGMPKIRYPIAQCRTNHQNDQKLYATLVGEGASHRFEQFGFKIAQPSNE